MRAFQTDAAPAMRTPTLHRSLWLLTLLAASATHAADKPKEASFGKGKGAGAYLTRDQLRSCLNQNTRVQQQDTEMLKAQGALNDTKADIARRGDALKERLAALDRADADAVNAYNSDAEARDKLIDEYQARVAQFNERLEAGKPDREAFAKACDNRRYFEEDEIAIKRGR